MSDPVSSTSQDVAVGTIRGVCRHCGYTLVRSTNEADKCPECGQPYSMLDPRTFRAVPLAGPCKGCGRRLIVRSDRPTTICTRCGRKVHADDTRDFTIISFNVWKCWLPALIGGLAFGPIVAFPLILFVYGLSIMLAIIPGSIGFVLGYGSRSLLRILFLVAILSFVVGFLLAVVMNGPPELAIVLMAFVGVPAFSGIVAGFFVRRILSMSRFSQAPYLQI